MIEDVLQIGGVLGIIIFFMIILLLPVIATIVLGIYIANALGLTGIVWWSFLIIFWLIIMGILSLLSK